jgi:hypothetical protein
MRSERMSSVSASMTEAVPTMAPAGGGGTSASAAVVSGISGALGALAVEDVSTPLPDGAGKGTPRSSPQTYQAAAITPRMAETTTEVEPERLLERRGCDFVRVRFAMRQTVPPAGYRMVDSG